ncbi:hypothetical protein [Rhodoblastus acidophilus]|uniref:hypothetical protein n=1 Tax=Rhodoblastus acidophilus TaxID=1074 RepID=UPI001131ACBB|nr:hypothetical protein [Rhodoblastus acidophilus]
MDTTKLAAVDLFYASAEISVNSGIESMLRALYHVRQAEANLLRAIADELQTPPDSSPDETIGSSGLDMVYIEGEASADARFTT